MWGDQQGVSPFGTSIMDLTAKVNFGHKITSLAAETLPRGSVLMPGYRETTVVETEHDYESDGIWLYGILPALQYDLAAGWQNGFGPFALTTNDPDKANIPAVVGAGAARVGSPVRVYSGGVHGAFMEATVSFDWTNDLHAGTLLCADAGEPHLVVGGLIDANRATHSRPIARVVKTIPAGTYAAAVSVERIKVFFRGAYGV